MVHYKLTYFNIMGRAEPARMIFAYAGQEFEDHRMVEGEFATLKPTLTFGQVPVLFVDGKELPQSNAIYRFLGRRFGLAGADDWEAAQCDMLVDAVGDAMAAFAPWWGEKDAAKKAEIWAGIMKEKVTPLCARFEKVLAANGSGHFVGSKMTWADIDIFCVIGWMSSKSPELLKDFPKLTAFVKMVADEPKIKAYIEKRPKTDM